MHRCLFAEYSLHVCLCAINCNRPPRAGNVQEKPSSDHTPVNSHLPAATSLTSNTSLVGDRPVSVEDLRRQNLSLPANMTTTTTQRGGAIKMPMYHKTSDYHYRPDQEHMLIAEYSHSLRRQSNPNLASLLL